MVPGRDEKHLALKMIDYDGMYVPALAGVPSGEVGHPAYQHPQRLREGIYNAEVDRFPLLVVYVAIRALMAGGRALWDRYDNADNLLFRRQDLEAPSKSALFAELLNLDDPAVRSLVEKLIDAARKPLAETPLLDGTRAAPPAAAMPATAWISPSPEAATQEPLATPIAEGPVATMASPVPVAVPSARAVPVAAVPVMTIVPPVAAAVTAPLATSEVGTAFSELQTGVGPKRKRSASACLALVAAIVLGGAAAIGVVTTAVVLIATHGVNDASRAKSLAGDQQPKEELPTVSAGVGKKEVPAKVAGADEVNSSKDAGVGKDKPTKGADEAKPPSNGPDADKAKFKSLTEDMADKIKVKPLTKDVVAGNSKPQVVEDRGRVVSAVPLALLDETVTLAKRPAVRIWRKKGIDLPSVLSNSSDKTEFVPGGLLPHKVSVHPSPNEFVAITWKSPIVGSVRVAARVTRLRPDGNGVAWWVEYRRSGQCFVLADGLLAPGGTVTSPEKVLNVAKGDLLMLAVDARNGDHGADHTDISFTVTEIDNPARTWDLAADVADTFSAGNPHADRQGNKGVWSEWHCRCFYLNWARTTYSGGLPRLEKCRTAQKKVRDGARPLVRVPSLT